MTKLALVESGAVHGQIGVVYRATCKRCHAKGEWRNHVSDAEQDAIAHRAEHREAVAS